MPTTKKITANRRNARKSTGPRTEAGKMRSSRNALKHGLTAKQVVLSGEDPAGFEALQDSLYAFYQPTNPVAEHLVEQVAASIWRLRRIPEIEAAIYAYFRLLQEYKEADERAGAQVVDEFAQNPFSFVRNEKALAKAEKDREHAVTKLRGHQPIFGEVFLRTERSLISLVAIAGKIEGSFYRAIDKLERMKQEQPDPVNDNSVIDAEADEGLGTE